MRRGPAIVLLFCLLFGAAYGAYRAGQEGIHRLNDFVPARSEAAPAVAGSTPLAGRLVIIVIDGLRTEEAHLLPSLEWLTSQGAGYQLVVPDPAGPLSVTASLLSGAPPTLHGEFGIGADRAMQADHLLRSAQRAKVKTGGAGSPQLGRLIAGTVETWYDGNSAEELQGGATALLKPGGPRLVLLQVSDLLAGIRAAGSAETSQADYRNGLAAVDARLVSIFDAIDWKSTAVMVTGNIPLNEHGRIKAEGSVPLLMAGMAVRPGARGAGSVADLAPTAAAILGLPMPLQAQGSPLLAALQVEGRPADAVTQSYLNARRTYAAAAVQAFGSAAEVPPPPENVTEAGPYLQELDLAIREARFNWQKAGLVERLPYLGPGLVVLLIYLIILWRQPFGGAAFLAPFTYGALFHLFFFLAGGRYNASLLNGERPVTDLLLRFGVVTAGAMAVTAAITGLLLSRKEFKRSSYLTTAALHTSLGVASLVALPVGVTLLIIGWSFPVSLPGGGLWVWFFLTALQIMVIGAGSPAWSYLTVRSTRLGQRLWPLPEVGNPETNADKVVRLRAIKRSRNRGVRG